MLDGKKCAHLKPSEGDLRQLREGADFPNLKRPQLEQSGKGMEKGTMWHSGTVILLPQRGSSPLSYNPVL